jgi:hypothetical protein
MTFTFKTAQQTVSATTLFDSTREAFRAYLCDGETPELSITVTQEDIDFEREKSIREDLVEGLPPRQHADAYLETIAVQRKLAELLFDRDILLFHGSVVAVDGQAYLFTAKSGTGKSTHTAYWREIFGQRAVMVNDDKPFLRITQEGVLACGSPWNGKHGLGSNICVPLRAICVLERGEENRIQSITPGDALFMLLQQSNRPMNKQKLPKYMELLDRLSAAVDFYKLQCRPEPEAARLAFEAMSQN